MYGFQTYYYIEAARIYGEVAGAQRHIMFNNRVCNYIGHMRNNWIVCYGIAIKLYICIWAEGYKTYGQTICGELYGRMDAHMRSFIVHTNRAHIFHLFCIILTNMCVGKAKKDCALSQLIRWFDIWFSSLKKHTSCFNLSTPFDLWTWKKFNTIYGRIGFCVLFASISFSSQVYRRI